MNIRGTGVAMITPFKEDHSLDEDALRNIIRYLINGKLEYIVALGTTGESVTLSKEEKSQILAITKNEVNGQIPIVCGLGGNNTGAILESIKNKDFNGIDAILSVSPYYNKPSQKGLIKHFETIADQSPAPVILYNVPGRTGKNILPETTLELAQHKHIIGIKEASGDPEQCMEIIAKKPKDFQVVSGDDPLTLPYLGLGMDGVISVSANALPYEMSEMVRAGLRNDFIKARKLHYKLWSYFKPVFGEGNPSGIKALMAIKGFCNNNVRPPLAPVSDELYEQLRQLEL